MSNTNKQLSLALLRSQKAYDLYVESKLYYQAMRIYCANKVVYEIAEKLYMETGEVEIFQLLFHLEDWFLQFKNHEVLHSPNPEDVFVFERVEGMYPYPKSFIRTLQSK